MCRVSVLWYGCMQHVCVWGTYVSVWVCSVYDVGVRGRRTWRGCM